MIHIYRQLTVNSSLSKHSPKASSRGDRVTKPRVTARKDSNATLTVINKSMGDRPMRKPVWKIPVTA